jgi:hypothetical protein
MSDGTVIGDEKVLPRLARIKPENESEECCFVWLQSGFPLYAVCGKRVSKIFHWLLYGSSARDLAISCCFLLNVRNASFDH